MKIEWLADYEFEVTESYDEKSDTFETSDIIVKAGEVDDVDIEPENKDSKVCWIQFGDGSIIYGVPKTCFKEI